MINDSMSAPIRQASAARAARPSAFRGRAVTALTWTLRAALALQFSVGGVLKLTGADSMTQMFADIGAGMWLRDLVGVLELSGAFGLLLPRLSRWAALGLSLLMVGALVTRALFLGGVPVVELAFLLLCLLLTRFR